MNCHLLESRKLKGDIGELVVSSMLRRKGFLVYRPGMLLEKVRGMGLPESYEVEFIAEHSSTMDFFAISPGEPVYDSREVISQLFKSLGLEKYRLGESPHQGFAVEVKSDSSTLSARQRRMMDRGIRLGFKGLLARVSFQEDYRVDVRFEGLE